MKLVLTPGLADYIVKVTLGLHLGLHLTDFIVKINL